MPAVMERECVADACQDNPFCEEPAAWEWRRVLAVGGFKRFLICDEHKRAQEVRGADSREFVRIAEAHS